MSRELTPLEAKHFADEFRVARETVLKDAENFDSLIHSVERLGSYLFERVDGLGGYDSLISAQALRSPLASEIPEQFPEFHAPFNRLYELVKDARNDAMHQGAFARRLAEHSVQLSLVLEDALRRGYEMEKVGEFMVRDPICGESWHPISSIRQSMLTNAFSYLPVKKDGVWCFVADLDLARYLAEAGSKTDRKRRLATKLSDAPNIPLKVARRCAPDASLNEALEKFGDDPSPLLIDRSQQDSIEIIGILAPFDLLQQA